MTTSEAGRPRVDPCERSMTGHVFFWTDSGVQNLCTQTVRLCLMPWLSMGDNMVNRLVAMTTKRGTFSLNSPPPPPSNPPARPTDLLFLLPLSDSCSAISHRSPCPSIATVISTPSWHNLCNNFFLLLSFCFYMFVETQRQHRSRQPTESVCVMNHGVPTTMCMTHNGPSPTW